MRTLNSEKRDAVVRYLAEKTGKRRWLKYMSGKGQVRHNRILDAELVKSLGKAFLAASTGAQNETA